MTDRTIPADARREIERRLDAIEAEFGVKIVFACESGSRAWGFASEDSDFDVRFLYARPLDWYLSMDVENRRDVIETPIEGVWDVNGWDLRKALRLMRKSNPPLLEWLQSPIVYREVSDVAERMRGALPRFHSPTASRYHYLNMARGNYRDYLQGEEVRIKKYFYVLRPLLACRWIERDLGAVPMEFERLVNSTDLDESVVDSIGELLVKKRAGGELGSGQRIDALNDFIEPELERLATLDLDRAVAPAALLNDLFRESLVELWGASLT